MLYSNDASPIEGATDLGYEYSCGPRLLDEIVSDMAENVLEISSASARRLSNSLASGSKDIPKADSGNSHSVVSKLKEAHPLAPMQVSKDAAAINEVVACRVLLNRSTGVCEVTGAQQQLILLGPDQRKQLHNDLIDLAGNQYTNYMKDIDLVRDKHAASDSANKASEQLQKFSDWLNTREGEPYTAIVDGANVGYYMQNFTNGRFNYHQIKFMVDTLEGKLYLVAFHCIYGLISLTSINTKLEERNHLSFYRTNTIIQTMFILASKQNSNLISPTLAS